MNDITKSIQEVYAAFANEDISVLLAILDSEVRWTEAEGFPYGGHYTGPEAVLQNVFMKLEEEWESFDAVAHEFITQGDTVVALGEYSGTFNATGKSFKAPFAHVWTFHNGKVVKFHQYTDTAVVQKATQA